MNTRKVDRYTLKRRAKQSSSVAVPGVACVRVCVCAVCAVCVCGGCQLYFFLCLFQAFLSVMMFSNPPAPFCLYVQ